MKVVMNRCRKSKGHNSITGAPSVRIGKQIGSDSSIENLEAKKVLKCNVLVTVSNSRYS